MNYYLQQIGWRPTIGDPTFMGWFTVFAYAFGAILSAVAWFRKKERIWLWVTLGMAALCVNKQLDLQTLFTDIGRFAATQEGWYGERREYQKFFVIAVINGSALFATWFFWRYHPFWLRHRLLVVGVFFLITFIVVRAISFHHVDMFLGTMVFGVKMNWALELGGIFLITLAALIEKPGKS